MQTLITDVVLSYWKAGRKTKSTPTGWISGNAPCCVHNGTGADTRGRGGLFVSPELGCSWHCFNCGFKASWQPGRTLAPKIKLLMKWLAVPDDLIAKCVFESLRLKDEGSVTPYHTQLMPTFFDKPLPPGTKLVSEWVKDTLPDLLIPVLSYMHNRGYVLDDYNWMWTDDPSYCDRLIIPFYYQSRIVGYTARSYKDLKVRKYLSEQQPGYVFNLDRQKHSRKFVLVTEGPLDAICVDGVAVMSNEANPQQRVLVDQLQREVIVIPDRDTAGIKLIDQAVDWGWSVSFPEWDDDIKDVNDAVRRYGKLYTLWSIQSAKETMPLKIKLKTKKWIPAEH